MHDFSPSRTYEIQYAPMQMRTARLPITTLISTLFWSLLLLDQSYAAPRPASNFRIVNGFRLFSAEVSADGAALRLRFAPESGASTRDPSIAVDRLKKLRIVAADGSKIRWQPKQYEQAPELRRDGAKVIIDIPLNDTLVRSQLPARIEFPRALLENDEKFESVECQGCAVTLRNQQEYKHGVRLQSFAGAVHTRAAGAAWKQIGQSIHPISQGSDNGESGGATVELSSGEVSQFIQLSDFGFNAADIPDESVVVGIGLRLAAVHSAEHGADVFIENLSLTRNGIPVGDTKGPQLLTGSDPSGKGAFVREIEYGARGSERGLIDRWGTALTPADLRQSSFGFEFRIRNRSSSTVSARLIAAQIVVYVGGTPEVRYKHLTDGGIENLMAGNWFITTAANSIVGNHRPDQILYRWSVTHPAAASGAMNVMDSRGGSGVNGVTRNMYKEQIAPYAAFYLPVAGTYTFRCDLIGGSGQVLARGSNIVIQVQADTRKKIYYGSGGSNANSGYSKAERKANLAGAIAVAQNAHQGKNVEIVGIDDDVVEIDKVNLRDWQNVIFSSDGSGTRGVRLHHAKTEPWHVWSFSGASRQISFRRIRFSQVDFEKGPTIFGALAGVTSFIDVETEGKVHGFLETSSGRLGVIALRGSISFMRYGIGFYRPPIFHFGLKSYGDWCCGGHTRYGGPAKNPSSATRRKATPQGDRSGNAFYYSSYTSSHGQTHRMKNPWTWWVGNLQHGGVSTHLVAPWRPYEFGGMHTLRIDRVQASGGFKVDVPRVTIASSVLRKVRIESRHPIEFDLLNNTFYGPDRPLYQAPTIFGAAEGDPQILVENSLLYSEFNYGHFTHNQIELHNDDLRRAGYGRADDQSLALRNTAFGLKAEPAATQHPAIFIKYDNNQARGFVHDRSQHPTFPTLVAAPFNHNSIASRVQSGDFLGSNDFQLLSEPRVLQLAVPRPGVFFNYRGGLLDHDLDRWTAGATQGGE